MDNIILEQRVPEELLVHIAIEVHLLFTDVALVRWTLYHSVNTRNNLCSACSDIMSHEIYSVFMHTMFFMGQ